MSITIEEVKRLKTLLEKYTVLADWTDKIPDIAALALELAEKLKDMNCRCIEPKPDDKWRIGEHEGRYMRCLSCDRRIWK